MSCLRTLIAAFVVALLVGCGPEFPPFWLIEPDPLAASGEIDPAGKLRVLAVRAEPPEVAPGGMVMLQSLVVTHPQQGQVIMLDGMPLRTPRPQGLSALWFVCRQPEEQIAPQPCGLGPAGTFSDVQPLPTTLTDDGPASELRILADVGEESLPASRIVTLIVADSALPGGATACLAHAMQNQGVVPDANHCLLAVKRVRVSSAAQPNQNPRIGRLLFGGSAEAAMDLSGGPLEYPLLDPALADDDRPQLVFSVERAADAIEVTTDKDGTPHTETLNASIFVTAGTLEAGRGSFLDLGCEGTPETCAQLPRTDLNWQPPAARAALEAPDQRVYFYAVVRDDRGGLSFMGAAVLGR